MKNLSVSAVNHHNALVSLVVNVILTIYVDLLSHGIPAVSMAKYKNKNQRTLLFPIRIIGNLILPIGIMSPPHTELFRPQVCPPNFVRPHEVLRTTSEGHSRYTVFGKRIVSYPTLLIPIFRGETHGFGRIQ